MTTNTSSDRDLFQRAGDLFAQRVHEVPEGAWDAPTPCTEWGIRELVNHVVGEQLWAVPLLNGESVEEVGSRFDGDLVGDDPVGVWDRAWAESRAAFGAAAEDAMVALSRGPTPLSQYRVEMLMDLVVHGWDLSRAASLDESGDPESAQRVLDEVRTWGDVSSWGVFDAPVPVESDDPMVQLVALLGRHP